jgi:hypothetical protein
MDTFLIAYPRTRINDRFVIANSQIDFIEPDIDYKDPIVQGSPNTDFRAQADFYKKIGIDIVTETVFDYPYPFITEKTFRPIASMRPFIVVGPCHLLQFIKGFGFKTFSAIIDESYDTIRDPEKRFISVCESIRAFVDRPLESVKTDLVQIKDILIHNRSCLESLAGSELEKFKQQI